MHSVQESCYDSEVRRLSELTTRMFMLLHLALPAPPAPPAHQPQHARWWPSWKRWWTARWSAHPALLSPRLQLTEWHWHTATARHWNQDPRNTSASPSTTRERGEKNNKECLVVFSLKTVAVWCFYFSSADMLTGCLNISGKGNQ